MITWAKRNGINADILESYTQRGGAWQDFVAVFLKDTSHAGAFQSRILDTKADYENGQRLGSEALTNLTGSSQSERKLLAITQIISEQIIIK